MPYFNIQVGEHLGPLTFSYSDHIMSLIPLLIIISLLAVFAVIGWHRNRYIGALGYPIIYVLILYLLAKLGLPVGIYFALTLLIQISLFVFVIANHENRRFVSYLLTFSILISAANLLVRNFHL